MFLSLSLSDVKFGLLPSADSIVQHDKALSFERN